MSHIAEKMLDGLIHLWLSIHSIDGRKSTKDLLDTLWPQLEDTAKSSTADIDADGFPTQFLREIFTLKPAQPCVDAIVATMDLGRTASTTGRKISKHEAQTGFPCIQPQKSEPAHGLKAFHACDSKNRAACIARMWKHAHPPTHLCFVYLPNKSQSTS